MHRRRKPAVWLGVTLYLTLLTAAGGLAQPVPHTEPEPAPSAAPAPVRVAEDKSLDGVYSSIIGAAIGSFFAFVLTYIHTVREDKRRRTLELVAEFNSAEMDRSRIIATTVLEANMKRRNPLSYVSMSDGSRFDAESFYHICRIIHFFEKMCILYEENYLNKKLARKTLRPYLEKYYDKFLRDYARITLDHAPDTIVLQWISILSRHMGESIHPRASS